MTITNLAFGISFLINLWLLSEFLLAKSCGRNNMTLLRVEKMVRVTMYLLYWGLFAAGITITWTFLMGLVPVGIVGGIPMIVGITIAKVAITLLVVVWYALVLVVSLCTIFHKWRLSAIITEHRLRTWAWYSFTK